MTAAAHPGTLTVTTFNVLHAARWAESLRRHWADRDPLVLLGGDLNAVPQSSSVRFLTGLQPVGTAGTYWVDAGDGSAGRQASDHFAVTTVLDAGHRQPAAPQTSSAARTLN